MADAPFTIDQFAERKQSGQPIVVLTAYDYTSAHIAEAAGVDVLLVGDSLAMTVQGRENTLAVSLREMIYHTRLVTRAAQKAFVVTDLPFMTYHEDARQAIRSAGRCIKQGRSHAVKLEGGERMAATIEAVVNAQIPVVGHIGLTPQSVNTFGGFKVQRERDQLIADAKAVENAGACALVIEAVPSAIAAEITAAVTIPTIGIGAGPKCDGQVLVFHDLLGLFGAFQPKFVKRYANLGASAEEAVSKWAADVRSGAFPSDEQTYK